MVDFEGIILDQDGFFYVQYVVLNSCYNKLVFCYFWENWNVGENNKVQCNIKDILILLDNEDEDLYIL